MSEHPRRGSLQFAPRVRARRIYPRVRHVPKVEGKEIVEFAGYKVGMLQVRFVDKRPGMLKNREWVAPATLIETPPLKILGARFYEKTPYGYKAITEVWTDKIDREVERKITRVKPSKKTKSDAEKIKDSVSRVTFLVSTQPKLAGISKKTPEIFEIHFNYGGEDLIEKAISMLGSELKVGDVFSPGDWVDAIAVTKGHGFQGSVKRFGVKILSHKARKTKRKAGTLGPIHPARTMWTVPQMGQMGFHTRTEYNKWVLAVGEDAKSVERPGGWKHYGIVRSNYIILFGSVPGVPKRLIRLRHAIRQKEKTEAPDVLEIIW